MPHAWWWGMTVAFLCRLLVDQLQVVQAGDAPAVRQVQRRNRRIGAVILVGEVGPHALVDGVERLRAVHQREGGDVGQVES